MKLGVGEGIETLLAGKLDDPVTIRLDLRNRLRTGCPGSEGTDIPNRLEDSDWILEFFVEFTEDDRGVDHHHGTVFEGLYHLNRVGKRSTDTMRFLDDSVQNSGRIEVIMLKTDKKKRGVL